VYRDRRIAVVIPALDEERSLPLVLQAIPRWVDRVVVVDNGSADDTAGVARRWGAVVTREPVRGYGRACLAGLARAKDSDIVVFLDADFSDYPEEMDALLNPVCDGEADLVIGSRTLGERQRRAMPLHQRLGNRLTTLLMRLAGGYRYTDLGPFRCIRTARLPELAMQDPDYGWTVEMQVKAVFHGLRIREVPVRYRRRIGTSKISGSLRGSIMAGLRMNQRLLRELYRHRRYR
jgi:glycosyltransferase involved in cell wall biosynthesis